MFVFGGSLSDNEHRSASLPSPSKAQPYRSRFPHYQPHAIAVLARPIGCIANFVELRHKTTKCTIAAPDTCGHHTDSISPVVDDVTNMKAAGIDI